jgi:hypothetical protein
MTTILENVEKELKPTLEEHRDASLAKFVPNKYRGNNDTLTAIQTDIRKATGEVDAALKRLEDYLSWLRAKNDEVKRTIG